MYKYQVAVIGDPETILGFKAFGAQTFEAVTENDALVAIERIRKLRLAIVFITEELATMDGVQRAIELLKSVDERIIVVEIPSKSGSVTGQMLGVGFRKLRKNVERAVGADILFKTG
jgi:V/A-type H+-transporting ATPase subunit F